MVCLALAACATNGGHGQGGSGTGSTGGTLDGGDEGGFGPGPDGAFGTGGDSSTTTGGLIISPSNPTVTVTIVDGAVTSAPTIMFTATRGGQQTQAVWTVDQGELGSITSGGVFTPTGLAGGTTNVTATAGSLTGATTVTVIINSTQNGFTAPIDVTGAGGYGGVGGEGPGGPVSAGDEMALQQPPTVDSSRSFLYPYDQTVWPRGLLAPLLQWTPGTTTPTAIGIHLESKTFVYDGYFARPAALAAGSPFVRHPIPQDVWHLATESTAGTDRLAVSVVFLVGGAAVGPISETWIVAPGILQGTVYYESYGTALVQNSPDNASVGGQYGAAVLGIKGWRLHRASRRSRDDQRGHTCRWLPRRCHSVAAGGSRLITQDKDWGYETTSLYTLQTGAETNPLAPPATCTMPSGTAACPQGMFAWAALSPDGQFALTNGTSQYARPTAGFSESQLFQIAANGTATQVTVNGLPPGVKGMTPTFSPDGNHVAYTNCQTTSASQIGGNATCSGDGHVVVQDFDSTGLTMTTPTSVFVPPTGDCVGFPSFMPTNDAVLVQLQLNPCYATTLGPAYVQTSGVKGEIWWSDVATGTQHRLDALNGYASSGTPYAAHRARTTTPPTDAIP